jgi:hypothetical protein
MEDGYRKRKGSEKENSISKKGKAEEKEKTQRFDNGKIEVVGDQLESKMDHKFKEYLSERKYKISPQISNSNFICTSARSKDGTKAIILRTSRTSSSSNDLSQDGFCIYDIKLKEEAFCAFTPEFLTKTVGLISKSFFNKLTEKYNAPPKLNLTNHTFDIRNIFESTAISNSGRFVALSDGEDLIYVLQQQHPYLNFKVCKEVKLLPNSYKKSTDQLFPKHRILNDEISHTLPTETKFIESIHFNDEETLLGIVLTENGKKTFPPAKIIVIKIQEKNQNNNNNNNESVETIPFLSLD